MVMVNYYLNVIFIVIKFVPKVNYLQSFKFHRLIFNNAILPLNKDGVLDS